MKYFAIFMSVLVVSLIAWSAYADTGPSFYEKLSEGYKGSCSAKCNVQSLYE